jgi:nucleoside-diphosphate-sugar epimerase
LSFQQEDNGEPQRTNLTGTQHLVELCEAAEIAELHHISTAYVAGKRTGRVLESELDVGQEFCNVYEESKLAAEQYLRASRIPSITVYRPSIIVGDSQTGYTTTFHGFYSPFRVSHMMARKIHVQENDLSILLSALGLAGSECKNFVPVEWCSQALVRIFNTPRLHQATYHLTSDHPFPVSGLLEAGQEVLGKEFRPEEALDIKIEDLLPFFREQLKSYEQYWRHDPYFDRTNIEAALPDLPCPKIDGETAKMLVQAAVDCNFGWPPEKKKSADDRFSKLFSINGFRFEGAAVLTTQPLGLQITGRGGGWWTGQVRDHELTAVTRGQPSAQASRLRFSSATFDALCAGHLTPQNALETGRIVVLGEGLGTESIARIVGGLVAAAQTHIPLDSKSHAPRAALPH